MVRARHFSHTKWASFGDRKRHLRDFVKIRPISRDHPPNPSATSATASCAHPPRARWHAYDGLPLSEIARGQRARGGPGRGVEDLGPPPTGEFGYVEIRVCRKFLSKISVENRPPQHPPLAPSPISARPGGPPGALPARPVGVCGPLRTPRGQYISWGGECGGEDPRDTPAPHFP